MITVGATTGALQNGEVTVDEFRKAVQNVCVGKSFNDFPTCFKVVISNFFKTVDVNGRWYCLHTATRLRL